MRRSIFRAFSGLILSCACLLGACDSATESTPTTDFAAQFDSFWTTFDRHYSFFGLKGVDWDEQRAIYEPRLDDVATQQQLIDLLIDMVRPLEDGHVWFTRPDGRQIFTWPNPYPGNFDTDVWLPIVQANGWVQVKRDLGYARFGEVGYIAVGSWSMSSYGIADLDAVMDALFGSSAIIVDVRANQGGDSRLADALAGRFTDREITAGEFHFRDGPGHDDFGPRRAWTIEPRGVDAYAGPVAVLAGRRSASSSEMFVSAMREIPHVLVMGDTTAGSSGNPGSFELTAGWSYTVSRWINYTADGIVIEGNGIPPDVTIDGFEAGRARGEDVVLDAALAWARSQ